LPRPTYRSRKGWRRIFTRTPGGTTKLRYERKKHDYPKCAICGRKLNIPRLTIREERRGYRTPGRPYSGNVCPSCLRDGIKAAVRQLAGM